MRHLPLFLVLLVLVACTPQPEEQQLIRSMPPPDAIIQERQEILQEIQLLGEYLPGDVINATRNDTAIRFTMSTGDVHVMDIATGIVYCTEQPHRGMRCHEAYFTYLDDSMIVDTQKGFSCISKAGSICDPAVTARYKELKNTLLG